MDFTGTTTALAYLQSRFPKGADRLAELVAAGQVYDRLGNSIPAAAPVMRGDMLYLFRDPPTDEPTVASLADIEVLFRDDHLLVVDKPHQVSVIPRGRWVTQTALVYLRNALSLPELSPLHRLDRPTAGVLAFSVRPEERGAYQMLFQSRAVAKTYLAVTAAAPPAAEAPTRISTRIVKLRGLAPAQQVPGEPNAHTEVRWLATRGGRSLFELRPSTGKTHQLRLHMHHLGLPILGDPFWPEMRPELLSDPDPYPPLQLLAAQLEFTDPIAGESRAFNSRRTLSTWERAGEVRDSGPCRGSRHAPE